MPVLFVHDVWGNSFGQCDNCAEGTMNDEYRDDAWHLISYRGDWFCENCYERIAENDDSDHDEDGNARDEAAENETETVSFESDYKPEPPRLMLPVIEGRDPRLISIEQEVGQGARDIAASLHAAGFSDYGHMLPYHSLEGDGALCKVEEDGSVNGEVIYSRLKLSEDSTARNLEDALCLVRDAVEAKNARLDMRCGFHVHVDAKGYGMQHVESLYHLWNHLEDTVYRLSAANWKTHRVLVAEHNYARQTQKGLSSRGSIGQYFESDRHALNFSNFLQARGYCRCGAFAFSDWENCSCNLPKSTVEFRVFNATANLRKIHAYTALSLAMTEAARREIFTVDKYPAFSFTQTEGMENVVHEGRSKNALAFLFERLPLTDSEREDLRYCADHSSLSEVVATL
jgi:hypothetical protein